MSTKIIYLFTAINWYRLSLFKSLSKIADLKVYILNGYRIGYDGIDYVPELRGLDITFLSDNDSKFPNLIKIIDKDDFDSIVVPSMNSLHFLNLTSKLSRYYHKKGKKILYFWEYWPMESSKSSLGKKMKQGIRHIFTKMNVRYTDKYIVPSMYTFAFYRKMGIPANKCVRCFNASEIDTENCNENQIRNDLNIPIKDKVVLYFGRIEEYKGINELVSAFVKLNISTWHLIICGPGDLTNIPHKENIHILGSINPNDRGKYYAAADLFVLPNTYKKKIEPWGLTVNEAMSFGLPILVTEATGSGIDLVFPGVNGYLMNSDNLESEISYYLKMILSDDILKNRLGANSKRIIANYTFDNMAQAFFSASIK